MCLAQGHNTVMLMRLKPATPQTGDKHSFFCCKNLIVECKSNVMDAKNVFLRLISLIRFAFKALFLEIRKEQRHEISNKVVSATIKASD